MILTSWDIQVTGKSIFNCSSCPKYFHLIFLTEENYYCMFIFFPNIMKHKSQKQSVYKIIPWFPFLLRKWKNPLVYIGFNLPKQKKWALSRSEHRAAPDLVVMHPLNGSVSQHTSPRRKIYGMAWASITPQKLNIPKMASNGHIYSRSHLFQGLSFWGPTTAVRWLGGSQDSWGWWQRS